MSARREADHQLGGPRRGPDARRAPAGVSLRPARLDDCRQVWAWRNDEATRRASFDSTPIAYATHERWFAEALAGSRRKLYVVVSGSRDVGVVRLDVEGRRAEVSIHLAPDRRGQGIGTASLTAAAALAFGDLALDELIASVKADNRASLTAFANAGFRVAADGPVVTLALERAARGAAPAATAGASAGGAR